MKNSNRRWKINPAQQLSCVFFCASLVLACMSSAFSQVETNLESRSVTIKFRDAAFGSVISYLTDQFDLSFGVELAPGDGDSFDFEVPINSRTGQLFDPKMVKATFSVDLKNARLAEVLDAIIDQMPGYAWAISDNVVNIYPKTHRDNRISQLMDLKIGSFVMEKERVLAVSKIVDSVVNLPEVKQFAKVNNVRMPPSHHEFRSEFFRPMAEIRMSKVMIKELLNRTALIKKGNWRVLVITAKDRGGKDFIYIEI